MKLIKVYVIGSLVLRIGGPNLLYTFSKLNKLPSTSYIYKTLKTSVHFEYAFEKKN
jgi:uncharacterized membrane protein